MVYFSKCNNNKKSKKRFRKQSKSANKSLYAKYCAVVLFGVILLAVILYFSFQKPKVPESSIIPQTMKVKPFELLDFDWQGKVFHKALPPRLLTYSSSLNSIQFEPQDDIEEEIMLSLVSIKEILTNELTEVEEEFATLKPQKTKCHNWKDLNNFRTRIAKLEKKFDGKCSRLIEDLAQINPDKHKNIIPFLFTESLKSELLPRLIILRSNFFEKLEQYVQQTWYGKERELPRAFHQFFILIAETVKKTYKEFFEFLLLDKLPEFILTENTIKIFSLKFNNFISLFSNYNRLYELISGLVLKNSSTFEIELRDQSQSSDMLELSYSTMVDVIRDITGFLEKNSIDCCLGSMVEIEDETRCLEFLTHFHFKLSYMTKVGQDLGWNWNGK